MTIPPRYKNKLEKLGGTLGNERTSCPMRKCFRGDKTNTLTGYGMPRWRDMFSPRQLLAHGYCVQAFHDLVDEDRDAGKLDESRKAAWCYMWRLGDDKIINRNSLLTRWNPNKSKE